MDLGWMAWTWQSATFFTAIGTALLVMTALELRWPTVARRGLLPLTTTRGDRFFMSLLGSAFIHVFWLAGSGLPLYWASLISIVYAGLLMRWG